MEHFIEDGGIIIGISDDGKRRIVGEVSDFFGINDDRDYSGVMMFWGGADISPSLYGEKNISSKCDEWCDERDLRNYERAKNLGIPCVGICRGAQFLWAMSGGKLVQDIRPAHGLPHGVRGLKFQVNSFHHQGCVPSELGLTILATHQGVVEAYDGVNKDGVRVFAVQWHPEILPLKYECSSWFYNKLNEIREIR